MSNTDAPTTTRPAANSLPSEKSQAAQILINSPINVSALGWIFESASQRTMRSIIQPKVIPITRVNVIA